MALITNREVLLNQGVPEERLGSFEKHRIYYCEVSGLLVMQDKTGRITTESVTPEKLVDSALKHRQSGNPLPVRILVEIEKLRPKALSNQDKKRLTSWKKKKH